VSTTSYGIQTATYTVTADGGAVTTKTVTLTVPCDSSVTIIDPGTLPATAPLSPGVLSYVFPEFTTGISACPILSHVVAVTGIAQSGCGTPGNSASCRTATLPASFDTWTATCTITATGGAVTTKSIILTRSCDSSVMLNNNWYIYYYDANGEHKSEYTNEADARTYYNTIPSHKARILYHENAEYEGTTAHLLGELIVKHPNYPGTLSESFVKDSGSGTGTYELPVFSTNN